MGKISSYTSDTSPTTDDYLLGNDATGPTTKRYLLSNLLTVFFNQINIPTGGGSPVTRHSEGFYNYVASGGVITGDSLGVNRNASMSAMVCYINGRRISINAVSGRTYTASRDTYVDVLDNADGTGTLVYTEVTNNNTSPALAANSLRIGIVVTGASTIAAAGSINQGQEDRVLPIASSIPYQVSDSLGNMICNRSPSPNIIGQRQLSTSSFTTASTSAVQVTGLSCPVIVPTNRKVEITLTGTMYNTTGATTSYATIWEGVVASGTQLARAGMVAGGANYTVPLICRAIRTPSSGSQTYNAGLQAVSGTAGLEISANVPTILTVRLL